MLRKKNREGVGRLRFKDLNIEGLKDWKSQKSEVGSWKLEGNKNKEHRIDFAFLTLDSWLLIPDSLIENVRLLNIEHCILSSDFRLFFTITTLLLCTFEPLPLWVKKLCCYEVTMLRKKNREGVGRLWLKIEILKDWKIEKVRSPKSEVGSWKLEGNKNKEKRI